ncbi:cysteine--tRNA ligase [Flavobacteriales bacterium]|nr:cysteine--tRNA ligase [Flavobacteriales bacterium]
MATIQIYNSITRIKEEFQPLHPPHVGLYVCGPTVYGDAHLGHARPYVTFDLVYRYLKYTGHKVRYVRNITDVGHLENDADEGEDKIAKKARLEKLEPMEVVKYYADRFHQNMDQLNTIKPSIEPLASGHIIEQIEMIKQIIDNGFAYESDGSVYFDVEKYNEANNYGKLSGRKIDELLDNTRILDGQSDKKHSADFALWKKAMPEHIMRWPSPWSDGFPGWHLECSAMSTKYLGEQFDIHGGGMDLLFPHHECEIAQNKASKGIEPVKYWMHNNMITINGQKMGKSLGNFITLDELFGGQHKLVEQPYEPMTVRFFILQAHYRSTVDFSNEALQAAEKGLKRLLTATKTLQNLQSSTSSSIDVSAIRPAVFSALNDDFNSPIAIAQLFDAVKIINSINDGKESISSTDLKDLQELFKDVVFDILGLQDINSGSVDNSELIEGLMNTILDTRKELKSRKEFELTDQIRENLSKINIQIKDTREGTKWNHEG